MTKKEWCFDQKKFKRTELRESENSGSVMQRWQHMERGGLHRNIWLGHSPKGRRLSGQSNVSSVFGHNLFLNSAWGRHHPHPGNAGSGDPPTPAY